MVEVEDLIIELQVGDRNIKVLLTCSQRENTHQRYSVIEAGQRPSKVFWAVACNNDIPRVQGPRVQQGDPGVMTQWPAGTGCDFLSHARAIP